MARAGGNGQDSGTIEKRPEKTDSAETGELSLYVGRELSLTTNINEL